MAQHHFQIHGNCWFFHAVYDVSQVHFLKLKLQYHLADTGFFNQSMVVTLTEF
jgi:hypothetical protein